MEIITEVDVGWLRSADVIKLRRQILAIIMDVNMCILDACEQNLNKNGVRSFDIVVPLQDIIDKHITDDIRKKYPGTSFWDTITNLIDGWSYSSRSDGILELHFGGLGFCL